MQCSYDVPMSPKLQLSIRLISKFYIKNVIRFEFWYLNIRGQGISKIKFFDYPVRHNFTTGRKLIKNKPFDHETIDSYVYSSIVKNYLDYMLVNLAKVIEERRSKSDFYKFLIDTYFSLM